MIVRVERIAFRVGDETVVGDLRLPAGPIFAMAVVAGPMTSVKEQVTGVAPKRLTWIDSEGQTDLYDDPQRVAIACDHVAAHLRECDLSEDP